MNPVPGFEAHAVRVVARVGKAEAEFLGVLDQPIVRRRLLESFGQWRDTGRVDIDGTTGVVLAETRESADAQNLVDGLASGQFSGDDLALIIKTAKGGDDFQGNIRLAGGVAHGLPLGGRGALHTLFASSLVEAD